MLLTYHEIQWRLQLRNHCTLRSSSRTCLCAANQKQVQCESHAPYCAETHNAISSAPEGALTLFSDLKKGQLETNDLKILKELLKCVIATIWIVRFLSKRWNRPKLKKKITSTELSERCKIKVYLILKKKSGLLYRHL